MTTMDISGTQMIWQPELIKLTTIHPNVGDGKPQACYVQPQWIIGIERRMIQHNKFGEQGKYPPQLATLVITGSTTFYVEELPDVVALLRDKAMGHKSKLEAV